jgi:DNA-directed RNA polymerase subunit M/transcription elongation factor TFIIS
MWRRKGCPRCRGDLFLDEDVGKNYIKCLQCGYEKELAGKVLSLNTRSAVKSRAGAIPLG